MKEDKDKICMDCEHYRAVYDTSTHCIVEAVCADPQLGRYVIKVKPDGYCRHWEGAKWVD